MTAFFNRIFRAMKLDATLYKEVGADEGAMGQAIGIVVLANIARNAGSIGELDLGAILPAAIFATAFALVWWLILSFITYMVGTRVLNEEQTEVNLGQLLRAIGFSNSPGLIGGLGTVPGLAEIAYTLARIWMLIALVIAVKQALDYQSTYRTVAVCMIVLIVPAAIWIYLTGFFTG